MKRNLNFLTSSETTVLRLALAVAVTLGLGACGGGGASYSAPDVASKAASVSLFSPATAVAGVKTTYLVSGVNLPVTVVTTLADGICDTPTNVTATSFSVACTAGSTTGAKAMIVKTDLDSNGGWWIGQQALAVTAAPRVGLLSDTGVTANQCYAAGSNALWSCTSVDAIALNDKQDGMVGRDVSNTDGIDGWLGSSYREVGAVGATSCVKDEVTGKTWQRTSTTLTALPGTPMNDEAVAALSAANTGTGLCGYTDWTIPSPSDLQGLVNYGITTGLGAIDGNWFTAKPSWYFTLTQYLGGASSNVWLVDFTRGQVNSVGSLSGSAELRLMRAVTPVAVRFTYSSDGSEVNDAKTGLIWQRCIAGQTWSSTTSSCAGPTSLYPHADALVYAKTQTAWRVPNVKELVSLVNTATKQPAIDVSAFPGLPSVAGVGYWSSTPDVSSTGTGKAWSVEFDLGTVTSAARSSSNFVRLVR
jgi:hypothetical protein